MIQTNVSVSEAGVLRGMHFHRRQSDYWCFLEGEAFVALHDVRSGSPTHGVGWWRTLQAADGLHGLYVPAGVAHGYYAVSGVRLQYHVDAYFDGGADELGFAWDDPEAAIPWPFRGSGEPPNLSERDRSNPSIAEALADAPAFRS
jgi:dTDP-4-dehydrorhamnose 3,5-epimerase